MDLADLIRELEALRDEALRRDRGRPGRRDARRARARVPRQEGRADDGSCAASASCRPRTAAGRRGGQPGPRGDRGGASPSAARACATSSSRRASRAETVDVTTARPADPRAARCTRASRRCARSRAIFGQFGFVVYESPEIEDDVTNFQLLNIPPDHPARDLWDTLYVDVEGRAAADAHVARPDPRHASDEAADPRAAARALLPLRGDRRQPRLRVLPGRGPDGRRGHDAWPTCRACSTSSPRRCSAPTSGRASGRATTRSPSRRWRSTSSASSAAASAARPAAGPAG